MQEFHYPIPLIWYGVVVDNNDPTMQGMVKVRIFGYYDTDADDKIRTEDIPWSRVECPTTSASLGGIGFSPTGILKGTHVKGYFADGDNCQAPVVTSTLIGKPTKRGGLWGDPDDEHPRILDESDVNRLARNENIDETIVKERNDNLVGAKIAFSKDREGWREQSSAYNAEYPYNYVYESVGGHIQEFDSTKGSLRYNLWHPSGSYTEIDNDGNKSEKVKSDRFLIIEKDDHILIKGDGFITLEGNLKVRIEQDVEVEIYGNYHRRIHGNYTDEILGNSDVRIKGRSDTNVQGDCEYNYKTMRFSQRKPKKIEDQDDE